MEKKVVVTFRDDIALKNGRKTDITNFLHELELRAVVEDYNVAIRRETAPRDEAIATYKALMETRPELSDEDKKIIADLNEMKAKAVTAAVAEKDAEIAKVSAERDDCKLALEDEQRDHAAREAKIKTFFENL